MNEQEQDRTQSAINDAFLAENGADFTYELGEKNIFLAKPTAEECKFYGLKQGEIVAVSDEGIYQLPREAFNAREQAAHGQWIEEIQEVYEARDFDAFMERAGFFDSVAKAHAETTPERIAERAAESARMKAKYPEQEAQWDAAPERDEGEAAYSGIAPGQGQSAAPQRTGEPPQAAENSASTAEEASADLEQTDAQQPRQTPREARRERQRHTPFALLPTGRDGHTRGGGRSR